MGLDCAWKVTVTTLLNHLSFGSEPQLLDNMWGLSSFPLWGKQKKKQEKCLICFNHCVCRKTISHLSICVSLSVCKGKAMIIIRLCSCCSEASHQWACMKRQWVELWCACRRHEPETMRNAQIRRSLHNSSYVFVSKPMCIHVKTKCLWGCLCVIMLACLRQSERSKVNMESSWDKPSETALFLLLPLSFSGVLK